MIRVSPIPEVKGNNQKNQNTKETTKFEYLLRKEVCKLKEAHLDKKEVRHANAPMNAQPHYTKEEKQCTTNLTNF